jgi:UDP-N-acetylmuramoyl-tripeptide--D-alanyl-D-alanine ligase
VIPLRWDEVEALALGELQGAPQDGVIRRVHDDSRSAGAGDLFVALNSGAAYVDDALERGAATLVPREQAAALAALATLVRARSGARVVAVVGSTGKTSTKDALGALCAAVVPTVAAEASRNNELGLPLTVLRLEPDTEVLVAEMGMRGLGQIAELCAVARPDVALVSSIGPEHLELVGTVADVARANAEAIEALPPGGIAVVPADAPELEPYLGRSDLDVRRFDRSSVTRALPASNTVSQAGSAGAGAGGSGHAAGGGEAGDAAGAGGSDGAAWRFVVPGGAGEEPAVVELALPFDQRHMAENVLAALTAYRALGLPLERAHEGAARIRLSAWRAEVRPLPGGGLVVNDAYNANPTSMRAALDDLAERAAGRRTVVILGEMAELGAASGAYHAEVAVQLRALGVDVVIGVGEPARAYLEGLDAETAWIADAASFGEVEGLVRTGDAVLVKASRAVGLEGIAAEIEKRARTWSAS